MRQRLNVGNGVLALGNLVLVGCGGADVPPLFLQFETEHYRYFASEAVCSALPDRLENIHDALTTYVGSEPEGQIEYRLASRAGDGCEGGGSCYRDGVIHSVADILVHELVHAVTDHVGDPPFLFEEGIAEVLGCQGWRGWPRTLVKDIDLVSLFQSDEFVESREENLFGTYSIAASFVRFLIDQGGEERFWQVYGSLGFWDSSATVATRLEEIYDTKIDALVGEWRDHLESTDERCVNLTLCASGAKPLTTEILHLPECHMAGGGQVQRTFEVGEGEVVVFQTDLSGDDYGFAGIESCSGGLIGPGAMNLGSPSILDASTRRTTYWVVRTRPGLYSWASVFNKQEYSIKILGGEPLELGSDNRAVLVGRYRGGIVEHEVIANVAGQLYTTLVSSDTGPPFTVEACVDNDCEAVVLETTQAVDLIHVNEGDSFTVRVSAQTFNGSVGAALAIRPDEPGSRSWPE